MNAEAYGSYQEADDRLNQIYQDILWEYQNDSVFIDRLKTSQRLWIKFRDAELEMLYPPREYSYGSMHPMCISSTLKQITGDRVNTLMDWLYVESANEGCHGSKHPLEEVDSLSINRALVGTDSIIRITEKEYTDYRLLGYSRPDIYTRKMILVTNYTWEVSDNKFNCKYGAYEDTASMKEFSLKYLADENEFIKVGIIKDNVIIDKVYMLRNLFEFSDI